MLVAAGRCLLQLFAVGRSWLPPVGVGRRRVPEIVLVPIADAAPGEEAEEEAPPGNNQI